jgi:putative Holliday junction resolvase
MPLLAPAALRETLPPKGALLGLDVGTKTIGIAISDPGRSVASPVETIRRTKFSDDVLRLEALIDSRRVIGFVIGLPVALDGSEGPRCQSVRQFAANLMARRDLPTLLWDERFSTAAVERFLVEEADMSRKRRAEVVDKMAAAYILQGALDALKQPLG